MKLTDKLLGYLNRVFEKGPDRVLSLRIRYDGGMSWKIADAGQIEEGSRHYVEFSFRLDTSLLPRPMQIGIATQPDWALSVERMQRFD